MKTQISRNSHRPEKRYSAVYQQQGRMLTDDDWNVMSQLVKERLDDVLRDVVGSGAPRGRGIAGVVSDAGTTTYQLQWGHAYVDGIVAQLGPDPAAVLDDPDATLVEYTHQADFPEPPPITAADYILYLDVWERNVTSLEDDELRDPGLHGADTCTRCQTMVQLKWCPSDVDPEDRLSNPPIGEAPLTLELRSGSTDPDPCDPCADEIELQDRVGSYLFRVEVHDVEYDSSGRPSRVTLKWSSENGAEHYLVDDVPAGFTTGGWVYEFVSGEAEGFASDKHLGYRLDINAAWTPARGQLEDGYPDANPAGFSAVRRWDGYCVLVRSGSDWQLASDADGALGSDRGVGLSTTTSSNARGHVVEGASVSINLDAIVLGLELDDHALLAGDFWMAPVREAVHVAGDRLLDAATPHGIRHHYMTVVATSGGAVTWTNSPWSAEQLRALRYPPLTDLNAEDVGYTMPECADPVALGQPTVRTLLEEALGSDLAEPGDVNPSVGDMLDLLLCRVNATHIPLEQNADLCATLQDPAIRSVQDGLNALCVLEADACSTFTVFPRPGWEEVFDRIASHGDAHVCFRDGLFELPDTVVVRAKGHLSLSGAGPGTRIVCRRRESALVFDDCSSVSLRNMHVESGAIAPVPKEAGLGGTVTVVNCGDVRIESASLKCAAAPRFGGTCISVRHELDVATWSGRDRSVRVRGCELNVGHYQAGLLLVNVDRSHVEDNHIRVQARPASLGLREQLVDPLHRGALRKVLIHDAVIRDFVEDAALDGSVQVHDVAGRRIQFRSPVADGAWSDLLANVTTGVTVASNQQLLDMAKNAAERVLVEPAFRNLFKGFRSWYERLVGQNPALAFRGIVCSGRVAKDVRILNNTLEGVLEGIHVGVGEESSGGARLDMAGTVTVSGNTMHVLLPPGYLRRRGGIFIGNCNHLTSESNHITVQRFRDTRDLAIDGIRIWGHLGRMMMVRQNYMTHCTTGVRVNAVDAPVGVVNQWLVGDNMMPGAAVTVAATPGVRLVSNLA